MTTRVIHANAGGGSAEAVRAAVKVFSNGGVVAFPTETVYGVGARADLPIAMERLRSLKSREAEKAFTVHIATRDDAVRFVTDVPPIASRLMRKAWPGPLTLILPVEHPRSAPIVKDLGPEIVDSLYYDRAIGLRCPDDPIAQALLASEEGPVVAASANLAGRPPAWTGEAALRDLEGRIDLLIDAGRTKYARPSTIVRVSVSGYEVLREGVLDKGSIERMTALRILFVCTGNTCRSPMAAGLARKALAEKLQCSPGDLPDRGVIITSAGVSASGGQAAPHAIAVMRKRGIDISDHVAGGLTSDMIHQADHVFAMTASHRARIIDMAPSAESKVRLVLEGRDIADPVGRSEDEYERCARTIEEGLRAALQEVSI